MKHLKTFENYNQVDEGIKDIVTGAALAGTLMGSPAHASGHKKDYEPQRTEMMAPTHDYRKLAEQIVSGTKTVDVRPMSDWKETFKQFFRQLTDRRTMSHTQLVNYIQSTLSQVQHLGTLQAYISNYNEMTDRNLYDDLKEIDEDSADYLLEILEEQLEHYYEK